MNERTEQEKAEAWDYYQELVKGAGFTGITDLLAEVTRLRASNSVTKEEIDGYVKTVPDQCDRIIWRNKYYHLPLNSVAVQKPIPEGWKLVPIEPTKEMIKASIDKFGIVNINNRNIGIPIAWNAMLAAAPTLDKG